MPAWDFGETPFFKTAEDEERSDAVLEGFPLSGDVGAVLFGSDERFYERDLEDAEGVPKRGQVELKAVVKAVDELAESDLNVGQHPIRRSREMALLGIPPRMRNPVDDNETNQAQNRKSKRP
jgi:hypothetical protein